MKKKTQNPTDTPCKISIGTRAKKLLKYLSEIKDIKRFSVREYSRVSGIPRSTLYDLLYRLQKQKIIHKPSKYNFTITEKGLNTLEVINGVSGSLRRECRDKAINLSTHYLKYKLKNIDKTKYNKNKIKYLNPIKQNTTYLRNLIITYIYFEDATIIIKPKTILITIHDIITKDIEESHFKTFEKALKYKEKLEKIGIYSEGMELQHENYARVESVFADVLYKKFGKYYTETKDGRKFWIDSSPPHKLEDETNDSVLREKLDDFINDVGKSESRFRDVDKIIEGLSMIEYVERVRMKRQLKQSESLLESNEGRSNYIG